MICVAIGNGSGGADNSDGTHTITPRESGLTLASTGGGMDMFVFQPGFGHDTLSDFSSHVAGAAHDTIALPAAEFASFAAVLADADLDLAADTIAAAAFAQAGQR